MSAINRQLTVLAVLPFAMMAAVALVDVAAGPPMHFVPLVSLGPAFAPLVGGWRRTACVGGTALLLCAALAWYDNLTDVRRASMTFTTVVGVTIAGLVAVSMRRKREAELDSVRSIAEAAQRVLLKPVPRLAGRLRAAVSYTSAVAEARIGGDLYEVVAAPEGVRVIVGDVQGKGVEAVETAAVVLGAFREAALDETDLVQVGRRIERSVTRQLDGEKFVTAILAEVSGHQVTFLNFGHPAPMLIRSDGTVHLPEPPAAALPLGLSEHGTAEPEPFDTSFLPGDQLLLYTDGIIEARDAAGRFYALTERAHLLKEADPEAALETLRQDLLQHVNGPLQDDAAMLLLRYR
ncbi:PP2C family protein-serine/threonine phosphatase [Streptomyces sp. NY05-11A]|uniref:PP2C family protein-serine/threonine phosphatase n=1 Tax=Streptomyces soliscabiei TaxID=588897 RepID=UPI0029BE8A06|nr:PP2C family protein-serine/threonine phosphatase [Streptomyces sp. NY05-11A]MDX2675395.1 PP2C family protein-serine/threonine phosphatase [Streptomyces sp. NY05-11A]